MAVTKDGDRFANAVLDALRAEIDRVAEEEIAAANERIATRVRQRVGAIALGLLKEYQLQRFGDNLVITVKHFAEGERK